MSNDLQHYYLILLITRLLFFFCPNWIWTCLVAFLPLYTALFRLQTQVCFERLRILIEQYRHEMWHVICLCLYTPIKAMFLRTAVINYTHFLHRTHRYSFHVCVVCMAKWLGVAWYHFCLFLAHWCVYDVYRVR